MKRRAFHLRLRALGAAVALTSLAVVSLAGQKPTATDVKAGGTGKRWTAPRTPWGDPDVSGVFTNRDVNGVPFERPVEFAGREPYEYACHEGNYAMFNILRGSREIEKARDEAARKP